MVSAIATAIEQLIDASPTMSGPEMESALYPILKEILLRAGFRLERVSPGPDLGIDYLGETAETQGVSNRIGIQLKHTRRPVPIDAVHQLAGMALTSSIDQLLLISTSGFSTRAVAEVNRSFPASLQLVDLPGLLAWAEATALEATEDAAHPPASRVVVAIAAMSREVAKFVAQNPRELDHLEWRDVERMVATVLEELGFEVELTSASKDGGKDIILTLRDWETTTTYIVELKHWRSGKGVGRSYVKDFVEVVAHEGHNKGLMLSTYGFTSDAYSALTETERTLVRFGTEPKLVSLCRTYTRANAGLWQMSPEALTELFLEDTT